MQHASGNSVGQSVSVAPDLQSAAISRTNLLGLTIWALGTFWQPIAFFFQGEIHWFLYNTGLLNIVRAAFAPIPAWLTFVSGPALALAVLYWMPISAPVRKRLAILPLVVLGSVATIWGLGVLIIGGWTV